ncbi:MAG: LamG domain-containing protein, partial [Nanoarchaeota archaeon]|nr:LamG domain-containing protein [Nanoarchaeota archaeon]
NQWHYITWRRNGTTIQDYNIFFDGQMKHRLTYANAGDASAITTTDLIVGNKYDMAYPFNGSMDEVRIWNYSLTEQEVYQQYIANLRRYDIDSWELYINQSYNATEVLPSDDYTYMACAVDTSSNQNCTGTRAMNISIDATAPVINLTSPSNSTSSTDLTYDLNFTSYDTSNITQCVLYVDSVNVSSNLSLTNYTYTFSVGEHNWSINCTDELSNWGSSSTYFLTVTSTAVVVGSSSPSVGTSSGSATGIDVEGQAEGCPLNLSIIQRVTSDCKINNGECDDGENPLFDKDCTVTLEDVSSGVIFYSMWFLRLILIIAFIVFFKKKEFFPFMVIIIVALLIMNGAIGTSITKLDKPILEETTATPECNGVNFLRNIGACIWPSKPMIGWTIVVGGVLLFLFKDSIFKKRKVYK